MADCLAHDGRLPSVIAPGTTPRAPRPGHRHTRSPAMLHFAQSIMTVRLTLALAISAGTFAQVACENAVQAQTSYAFPPSWQAQPPVSSNPFQPNQAQSQLAQCMDNVPEVGSPAPILFDAAESSQTFTVAGVDGETATLPWVELRRLELPSETALFSTELSVATNSSVSDVRVAIVSGYLLSESACTQQYYNVLTYSFKTACGGGGTVEFAYGTLLSSAMTDEGALALADLAFAQYEETNTSLEDWWWFQLYNFPYYELPSGQPIPFATSPFADCVTKIGPRPNANSDDIDNLCDQAAMNYLQCLWDASCIHIRTTRNAASSARSGSVLVGVAAVTFMTGAVAAATVCTAGTIWLAIIPISLIVGGTGYAGFNDLRSSAVQLSEANALYNADIADCLKNLLEYSQQCE